ncbi:MAG: hypothetical protein KAQ92_04585, partial [Candidatus Aenigmarchaeota archaeon]|nr:hypothetical protein [Candidatus Aenigmarchaeota archaeon]
NLTDNIAYNSLYFFRESTSSYEIYTPEENPDYIWFNWYASGYTKGKIVYDINQYTTSKLKFVFGDITDYIHGFNYYEQAEPKKLDLNNPIFTFGLCSFNDTYWKCSPQYYNANEYEPGYYGLSASLTSGGILKYLRLPKNSTVTAASLQFTTNINESIANYNGLFSSFSQGSFSPNTENEIAFSNNTHVNVQDNSAVLWSYPLTNINEIAVGNILLAKTRDEIAIATTSGIKVLNNTGGLESGNWPTTGTYTHIHSSDLITAQTNYWRGDLVAENLIPVGKNTSNTKSRFTINYTFDDFTDKTCFIKSAINYKGAKSGDMKFTLNNTDYDIDEAKITKNARKYHYDDDS